MDPVLQSLTADLLVANVRREKLNGRDYVVVPATMIVPGVLPGSDGPGYYSAEVTGRDPGRWDGMPIMLDHPVDNTGKPLKARSPKVLDGKQLGFIYETTFNSGKLGTEAWFDVEHTKARSPSIYARVTSGQPVELSTGVFVPRKAVKGTHNGTAYEWEATDLQPDHLAVFENKKGACSVADGCGVNNAADRKTIWQRLGELLGVTANKSETPPAIETPTSTTGDIAVTRTETINWLTTNCDRCKGKDKLLANLSDEELTQWKADADRILNERKALAAAGVTVANGQLVVNAMSAEMMAQCEEAMAAKKKPAANAATTTATTTEKKTMTDQEWLATAPPGVQSAVRNSMAIEQREKNTLVERLIVNVQGDDARKQKATWLQEKSLDELRDMVLLLPTANVQQQPGGVPIYLGQGGGQTVNQAKTNTKNLLPTFEAEEAAA